MNSQPEAAPDAWEGSQKILVILAHPDDPEFFCGATLARWSQAGHIIHYVLLTCGDKGFPDADTPPEQICAIRHAEQKAAAAVLGVRSVSFLDLPDGYLVPSLELRRQIVRVIRQEKPDVLVTCDPTTLFSSSRYLNHPDHRAAGQVVLDAAFPAAGNPHFFPELRNEEGLEPHTPREIWVSLTEQPTVKLDVTRTWDLKLRALREHKSQIGDPVQFEQRMLSRRTPDSSEADPRFEESFRVIKYRS
jgi:LmbE family N-acetylglucosaminyl deacetylase